VGVGIAGLQGDGAAKAVDGRVECALVLPGHAQVVVRPGEPGQTLNDPLVTADGLLHTALILERGPQVQFGHRIAGLPAQRLLIAIDCLGQFAPRAAQVAQVVPGLRHLGVQPQRLLVARHGLVKAAQGATNHPPIAVQIGLRRRVAQGLVEERQCLFVTALVVGDQPQPVERLGMVRHGRQDLPANLFGQLIATGLLMGDRDPQGLRQGGHEYHAFQRA